MEDLDGRLRGVRNRKKLDKNLKRKLVNARENLDPVPAHLRRIRSKPIISPNAGLVRRPVERPMERPLSVHQSPLQRRLSQIAGRIPTAPPVPARQPSPLRPSPLIFQRRPSLRTGRPAAWNPEGEIEGDTSHMRTPRIADMQ